MIGPKIIRTWIHDASSDPPEFGEFMLLCREWVGGADQRPAEASWVIRDFDQGRWQRAQYSFDTGGYEEFEAVAWARLPSNLWP